MVQINRDYIQTLGDEFIRNENPIRAKKQKAYLKGNFHFFGLTSLERREIQRPFLVKNHLPPKNEISDIIVELWDKPQREFHYFAQELAFKYIKQIEPKDIELYEYMVVNQSWWDTIDFISPKLIGSYFKKFPEKREYYINKWIDSKYFWFQRSALLFQLKYKKDMDVELLKHTIHRLLGSNEFFINKAIGWILREFSRTNPEWVRQFVSVTELHNLSRKEALRLMI